MGYTLLTLAKTENGDAELLDGEGSLTTAKKAEEYYGGGGGYGNEFADYGGGYGHAAAAAAGGVVRTQGRRSLASIHWTATFHTNIAVRATIRRLYFVDFVLHAPLYIQSGAAGFNTRNGEKLSYSQAASLVGNAWLLVSFSLFPLLNPTQTISFL